MVGIVAIGDRVDQGRSSPQPGTWAPERSPTISKSPRRSFAKDGIPLEEPYWADTVNIAPGERYSVLVNPDRAGVWAWHCHILTHVERHEGMVGMVSALIVEEA